MRGVNKTVKTYEYYRSKDKAFAAEVDKIRLILAGAGERKQPPPFPEFSREYLGQEVFTH